MCIQRRALTVTSERRHGIAKGRRRAVHSRVWVETGTIGLEPATLALASEQLSLVLHTGTVVFEEAVENVRATFPRVCASTAFDIQTNGATYRLTLVCPLPDPNGIAAARRAGRMWQSVLA
jgi:hypothetical protein